MARAWRVGVVPEYLTGYRATPGAMSSDGLRMGRSKLLALERVRVRCPDTPADAIAAAEASLRAQIAAAHLFFRRWPLQAAAQFLHAACISPRTAMAVGAFLFRPYLRAAIGRKLGRLRTAPQQPSRVPFAAEPPAAGEPLVMPHPLNAWLATLSPREEDHFASAIPPRNPVAEHSTTPAPRPIFGALAARP
jgi:hypothetical protein